MRVFVTGAGGFVGAAVAHAAHHAGHDVVGTIRPGGDPSRLAGLPTVELDLADRAAVLSAVAAARPDVIVHSAWSGVAQHRGADLAHLTDNLTAIHHLLEAGAAKFVGLGSQGEYGLLDAPVDEDHLPAPTSVYGAAKLAALHLARVTTARTGAAFAWLRLFAAYGPGDQPHWLVPSLIRQMLTGQRPRTTSGVQRWDYLYIDDAAQAVLAVATTAASGVFNLGSGVAVPVRTVVEKIRDRAAPGLDLVFGEIPHGPTQIWHLQADITRLRRATGWAPQTDLDTGLDRTVAWCRGACA